MYRYCLSHTCIQWSSAYVIWVKYLNDIQFFQKEIQILKHWVQEFSNLAYSISWQAGLLKAHKQAGHFSNDFNEWVWSRVWEFVFPTGFQVMPGMPFWEFHVEYH